MVDGWAREEGTKWGQLQVCIYVYIICDDGIIRIGCLCVCVCVLCTSEAAARSRAVGGEPTEGERCEEEGEPVCLVVVMVVVLVELLSQSSCQVRSGCLLCGRLGFCV